MEKESLAYRMGKLLFGLGYGEDVNPYTRGPARYNWFSGFFDARTFARFGFVFALLFCMTSLSVAKDVDAKATREIDRRGNHVETTGVIRSGLMAAALAPPEDDSDRWFITLVYQPGDALSERVKIVVENDKDLRQWIDYKDPIHSFMTYHARAISDGTQRSWLEGLKPAIEKNGLPMIVIQPPLSGQFGEPSTIVRGIHGDQTGKELSAKIRESIVTYVNTIESNQPVAAMPSSPGLIGISPPFVPKPKDKPVDIQPALPAERSKNPIDWPDAAPKTLTYDQIEAACPGAPAQFILDALKAKVSNEKEVGLEWRLWRAEHAEKPPAHPKPEVVLVPREEESESSFEEPTQERPDPVLVAVGIGALLLGLIVSSLYRKSATLIAEMRDGIAVSRHMKEIDKIKVS